jgi:cellobiose phosphorylase
MGQGEKAEALFRLANPIYHAETQETALEYRVEPYVIAADVYGVAPHTGRGGWTWYTGSSGWMYRLGLEAILGVRRQGNALRIKPAIPAHWPGYNLTYRFGGATYHIEVLNAGEQGANTVVSVDGERMADGLIPLRDDGREHTVQVRLPA